MGLGVFVALSGSLGLSGQVWGRASHTHARRRAGGRAVRLSEGTGQTNAGRAGSGTLGAWAGHGRALAGSGVGSGSGCLVGLWAWSGTGSKGRTQAGHGISVSPLRGWESLVCNESSLV